MKQRTHEQMRTLAATKGWTVLTIPKGLLIVWTAGGSKGKAIVTTKGFVGITSGGIEFSSSNPLHVDRPYFKALQHVVYDKPKERSGLFVQRRFPKTQ